MFNRLLKVTAQIICLMFPILYWNLNADSLSRSEVISAFALGWTTLVILELAFRAKETYNNRGDN